jgi:hypothetical protein
MYCTPKVGQYDILKKLWGCIFYAETEIIFREV